VGTKAPDAFRTIGELSEELGVAQHILRYWETKFPLKPLQRAGNRRYYRPADIALARRINRLLNEEGYTVRGVQKVLREGRDEGTDEIEPVPLLDAGSSSAISASELRQIRNRLVRALED
jgi:DNA-binding transcriptional MerR regulator